MTEQELDVETEEDLIGFIETEIKDDDKEDEDIIKEEEEEEEELSYSASNDEEKETKKTKKEEEEEAVCIEDKETGTQVLTENNSKDGLPSAPNVVNAHGIVYGEDPRVEGAEIGERDIDEQPDQRECRERGRRNMKEAVILYHIEFTTSKELLQEIRWMFCNALEEHSSDAAAAQNFRLRLITLVKDWMRTTWSEDFEENAVVLQELDGLQEDIRRLCTDGVSKALIQKLENTKKELFIEYHPKTKEDRTYALLHTSKCNKKRDRLTLESSSNSNGSEIRSQRTVRSETATASLCDLSSQMSIGRHKINSGGTDSNAARLIPLSPVSSNTPLVYDNSKEDDDARSHQQSQGQGQGQGDVDDKIKTKDKTEQESDSPLSLTPTSSLRSNKSNWKGFSDMVKHKVSRLRKSNSIASAEEAQVSGSNGSGGGNSTTGNNGGDDSTSNKGLPKHGSLEPTTSNSPRSNPRSQTFDTVAIEQSVANYNKWSNTNRSPDKLTFLTKHDDIQIYWKYVKKNLDRAMRIFSKKDATDVIT
ncbi:hypothetical protein RFI_13768, partial [Reticulomyxa filosa]